MSITYEVVIPNSVAKAIRRLDEPVQRRVLAKVAALSAHPRPSGTVALAGEPASYRVRVGDYRIVYEVHDAEQVVLLVRVGHRREVYR